MKIKMLIFGFLALVGVVSIAMTIDKTEVPKVVKEAFAQKYPAAQKVKWEMEDDNEYEAEFKLNGKEMSANFKADGTWLETETEIDEADLPEAVKKAIETQFPDFEIEEAEQLEKPGMGLIFEVELENEKNDTEMEAVFTSNGTLIKKEVESHEGKKDGDDEHK